MLSAGSRQLRFVFADSPQGGGSDRPADESAGRSYLLHTAELKEASDPAARTVETDRLLEQAASEANLAQALLKVARNKGAAGVDGRSVQEVVAEAPRLLPILQRELLTGTYRPGDIRRVWIAKPGGGHRGLGIPNVMDRWVQQAVLQVLEPHFEPKFHSSSHGFRPGRGAQTAIAEAKKHLAEGYTVTVDIDLSKFFDRVNHQRLLNRMGQRVADGRLLKLVHRMLKTKVVLPDGTRIATDVGAPQGGPLSPLLSNIVLDELDWELERRGLRFVRYADDFSVFVRSERAARRVKESLGRFIEGRLRLVVNAEKSSITGPNELTFLGFRLGKNDAGQVTVTISDRTKRRVDTRIRELTPRMWGQTFGSCLSQINRYLRGWIGYFRLCTEDGLRPLQRIDAHIRRRLRAILMRRKRRRCHLYRDLVARGIPKNAAAKTAFQHRGIWHRSISFGIHKAYRNTWFASRLVSLESRWYVLNLTPRVHDKQLALFD